MRKRNFIFISLFTVFGLIALQIPFAVGGALWVWAFGLTRQMWLSLIPQTMMERVLMAGGITAVYLALNQALKFAAKKKLLPAILAKQITLAN